MEYSGRPKIELLLLLLACLIFCETAGAYMDPGSGSYFLQIILAALFGGLFAIKLYWQRIKTSIVRLLSKRQRTEADND